MRYREREPYRLLFISLTVMVFLAQCIIHVTRVDARLTSSSLNNNNNNKNNSYSNTNHNISKRRKNVKTKKYKNITIIKTTKT